MEIRTPLSCSHTHHTDQHKCHTSDKKYFSRVIGLFPSVGWHVVKSHLGTGGEVSLEGGWAGYGEGTSIHSNLHGGDRKGGKGGRWVVWLGDWGGDVTPRYIRLSFSVSAVSPLMNNTNATNYTKIGDNSNYHH